MITIDELFQWPTTIRCFKDGACHLRSTTSDDELHAFAARLGLRRQWFQTNPKRPGDRYSNHYGLTPRRRERALQLGAKFVPGREQARAARARRKGGAS